ncbi:unnamed protein product [Brachionus calyciflorus]|uniref:Uncharacterized protein n=1 Tax=Brachionus calyciflorus TaxID=104777 RepID=A0A813M4U5_9BILA|nr:unnamed protein product [Brachionus calyciflorus]
MANKIRNYDYLFRVVIIGDSGVGKTNLLLRYTKDQYSSILPSTIGIDFSFKNVEIDSKIIRAHVWDTAGQDKFMSLASSYYHGVAIALLVYDITNLKSYQNVSKWLDELRKYADDTIIITLVGNKSDLEHLREVDTLVAKQYAIENNFSFIETSAFDSTNVEIAFKNALTDAYNIRVKNGSAESIRKVSFQMNPNASTINLNQQTVSDRDNTSGNRKRLRDECCN